MALATWRGVGRRCCFSRVCESWRRGVCAIWLAGERLVAEGEVVAQVSTCSCRYCDCFMMITYGAIGRLASVDVFPLAGALQVEHGPCSHGGFPARLPDRLLTLGRSLTPGGRRGPGAGGLG